MDTVSLKRAFEQLPLCGPLYAPGYFRFVSSPHRAEGAEGDWQSGRQAAGLSQGRNGSIALSEALEPSFRPLPCPPSTAPQFHESAHISPRIQHSQQAPSDEAGGEQGPQSQSQRRTGTAARPQSGAGEGASSTHSGGTAGPAAPGRVRWPVRVLSTHSSQALSCWRACCRCSSPEGKRVERALA